MPLRDGHFFVIIIFLTSFLFYFIYKKITDHIYCCRSGSAAHTQAVADIVSFHTEFMAAQMEEPGLVSRGFSLF